MGLVIHSSAGGSGGPDFVFDEATGGDGEVYQITKVSFGSAGAITVVDTSNPLPVRIGDGTDLATVRGGLGAVNALDVAIVDGSGNHITSFGGGTQYVVNDVAPTNPTGTAGLMERDDALSTLSEVEADWTNMRSNARGALWVAPDPLTPGQVIGDEAHDSVWTSANQPLMMGAFARASAPTAVSDDDYVCHLWCDVNGRLHVADGAGSLTVDAPVGTPVNVQIGDGTRTATVRDTGGSDSLNVAIVDASGNHVTSFGGGTQYTLGTATYAEATSVGTLAGAVRKDSGGTLVNADNEIAPLQVDSDGYLRVNVAAGVTSIAEYTLGTSTYIEATTKGTIAAVVRKDSGGTLVSADNEITSLQVDGNGALRVTGGGGGTEYTEDVASAADPVGQMLIARRRDSLVTETTAAGDNTAVNCTDKGEIYVKHSDSIAAAQSGTWNITNISGTVSLPTGAATEATLSSLNGKVTACDTGAVVISSGTVSISGSIDTELPTAAALADNTANPTVPAVGSFLMVWDGTTWDRAPGTSADGQLVNLGVNNDVTVSGTVNAAQSGAWTVQLGTTDTDHLDAIETAVEAINTKITTCNTGAVVLAAGTNNIGDVDVLTLPALAAGTNRIGSVRLVDGSDNAVTDDTNDVVKTSAALRTDVLVNGTATASAVKFESLSTASTGNQSLVAAVSGKKIRIIALQIMATASTNAIYINDGTADLYGDSTRKIPLDVTGATGLGGLTLPFNPLGWFETADVNRPININLGSANGVIAIATYVEI